MSKKTDQIRRAMAPFRANYLRAAGACEVCRGSEAEHVHEITAGSSRQRAFGRPNVWLAVCASCHDKIQGSPFVEQYELKCEAVRHAINDCLGRAEL